MSVKKREPASQPSHYQNVHELPPRTLQQTFQTRRRVIRHLHRIDLIHAFLNFAKDPHEIMACRQYVRVTWDQRRSAIASCGWRRHNSHVGENEELGEQGDV